MNITLAPQPVIPTPPMSPNMHVSVDIKILGGAQTVVSTVACGLSNNNNLISGNITFGSYSVILIDGFVLFFGLVAFLYFSA